MNNEKQEFENDPAEGSRETIERELRRTQKNRTDPAGRAVEEARSTETNSDPKPGSIKAVDLALHGNGISHWQDEPEKPGDDRQDDKSQS